MLHSILKKYLPSLGKSWLFVLVFLAGTLLISYALAAAPEGSFFRSTSCMYLCSFLPLFIFIFFDAKNNAKPYSQEVSISHATYGNLSPFIFYPVIALAVICLEIAIEPISALIPMPDAIKTLFENMLKGQTFADTLICTVILAPIVEETLCRGIICRGLLTRMKPWKAIVWAAFIFAVLHMNPYQGIPAFALGCLFGWVYYRTHCLLATILMHGFNNLLSVLLTINHSDMPIDSTLRDYPFFAGANQWKYWAMVAVCVVVFALIILFLQKKLSNKNTFVVKPAVNEEAVVSD